MGKWSLHQVAKGSRSQQMDGENILAEGKVQRAMQNQGEPGGAAAQGGGVQGEKAGVGQRIPVSSAAATAPASGGKVRQELGQSQDCTWPRCLHFTSESLDLAPAAGF